MSYKIIELPEITKDRKLSLFYNKVKNNVLFIDNEVLYNYIFYMNDLYYLIHKRKIYILNKCKDTTYEPTLSDYYDLSFFPNYALEIVELYKITQHYIEIIKKYWNYYNPIINNIIYS